MEPRAAAFRHSSDSGQEISPCSKITYESKDEANREAARLRAHEIYLGEGKKSAKKLRSYRCPRCGKYHLTTTKQHRLPRRGGK